MQGQKRGQRHAASVLAALLLVSLPAAGVDWPQFRGDPTLTGVAPEGPADGQLEVAWSYDTGDAIDSSAAVVDGSVYVGVGNGDLIALDLETGELSWTYATGSFFGEASPSVSEGIVYIGDLDGVLHAVRADEGTAVWTFPTQGEIRGSAAVVDDTVLVGSYDTNLYAIDRTSGELQWKFQTDGQVHATPAVRDGLAFVAGCDGAFRAITIADGSEAYQVFIGSYTGASPLMVGNRAYFGTYEYEVLAIDLDARDVAWRYSTPGREFPFYSSAALYEDTVILGGRDKFVHALDAETGEARWTFETRARVDSSPVVSGGLVYVGSSDRRFYVLDANTGEEVWTFDTGAAVTASPGVASGRVVVGATDGVIYAFE
jgi:outer membrane protein assembly factor BamB